MLTYTLHKVLEFSQILAQTAEQKQQTAINFGIVLFLLCFLMFDIFAKNSIMENKNMKKLGIIAFFIVLFIFIVLVYVFNWL